MLLVNSKCSVIWDCSTFEVMTIQDDKTVYIIININITIIITVQLCSC